MLRSGARVTSTREAVEFELELPGEADQPGYMKDVVAMVRAGLIGGISPGFTVPPRAVVPDGERLEPEPGNAAVQVRVIENAILSELSIVTRPAHSETDVDVRALEIAAHATEAPGMALTLTQAELSAAIRLGDSTEEVAEAVAPVGIHDRGNHAPSGHHDLRGRAGGRS